LKKDFEKFFFPIASLLCKVCKSLNRGRKLHFNRTFICTEDIFIMEDGINPVECLFNKTGSKITKHLLLLPLLYRFVALRAVGGVAHVFIISYIVVKYGLTYYCHIHSMVTKIKHNMIIERRTRIMTQSSNTVKHVLRGPQPLQWERGYHGRDRMVVWFATTCAISVDHY
jgi:hypothetical protein